jgi:hypothetical protein
VECREPEEEESLASDDARQGEELREDGNGTPQEHRGVPRFENPDHVALGGQALVPKPQRDAPGCHIRVVTASYFPVVC